MSYSSPRHSFPRDCFLLWPPAEAQQCLPGGCASFLTRVRFARLARRHWLRVHRHRVPPECVLHRHPGLGHLLPIPVLPAGASLGPLQPQLEHTAVHGGHPA